MANREDDMNKDEYPQTADLQRLRRVSREVSNRSRSVSIPRRNWRKLIGWLIGRDGERG